MTRKTDRHKKKRSVYEVQEVGHSAPFDNKDPVVIGKLPLYMTEKMLLTTDVGEKKFYSQPKAGESMWKRWLRIIGGI